MDSLISVEDGPFPVAVVNAEGQIIERNDAWSAIAPDESSPVAALGLSGFDAEDLIDAIALVADDQEPAWIDLDAAVLAERRWSRCHLWPARDRRSVIMAVVSLRETRDIELSRVETEHVERILEHTADAITIVDKDMSFRFASGIATRWLGMSGAAYEGRHALSFVFADDHHILIDAFTECIENPRRSIKARFRAVHESGDLIWVEGIGTNMFDDPAIRGILVTLNDITELVETQAQTELAKAALEAEKQRYETLAQFTPTGVFELNAENQLTFHNERFEQLIDVVDPVEFSWDLFDARDREALRAALARTMIGTTTQSTVRLAKPVRGEQRWLTIRTVRQDDDRILGSIEDATTQIAKQAELEHRADHDVLTGLPNRENLLEQLDELTSAGEPIAVLFLDLDNFKDINDGLGHQVGDQVLIEVAHRIAAVVRPHDIVGRLHGDEFLVVCRRTSDVRTAREIASRVVASVGQPLMVSAQQLLVSGSIGIAMNDDLDLRDTTPEQLLVAADVAMYEAKRRGGARSVPFNDELGKRAADRLRLHGEVQRAAELNELELHYQPIIDLTSGRAVRAEALVRWHHPTQGFILPERFIPEIEKSELIDQLGTWILDQVIADAAAHRDASPPLNVNVSPRQLADASFAAMTLDLLDRHGVDGDQLTIEITELVMMDDFDPVEQQLRLLRSHGVGIAIDDFGTGYSALAYLQRFPFDQVKIDGVFIEHLDTKASDQAIVGSMIELVRSLGSTPIAEKVERQAQANTLMELGCTLAQGFLLGLPAPLRTTPVSESAN